MTYEKSEEQLFNQALRLHPIAIVLNLLRILKETIFGIGIGFVVTLKESVFYFFIFLLIFLVLLLVVSFLSWLRFSYRVEEGELRIEQGIFIRKKRYISLHRIHKIDFTANVLHRLLKLVQVQIDTASSGDGAEVSLSAIDRRTAKKLRGALQKDKRTEIKGDSSPEVHVSKKITWRRLFIAGTTSGSVGIILLAFLAFFSQIEEFVPDKVYNAAYVWIIGVGIAVIVVL